MTHMQDWLLNFPSTEYAILRDSISYTVLRDIKKPSHNCSSLSLLLRVATFPHRDPHLKSTPERLSQPSHGFASHPTLHPSFSKEPKNQEHLSFTVTSQRPRTIVPSLLSLLSSLPGHFSFSFPIVWSVQLFTPSIRHNRISFSFEAPSPHPNHIVNPSQRENKDNLKKKVKGHTQLADICLLKVKRRDISRELKSIRA